jgi:hypothetical protein
MRSLKGNLSKTRQMVCLSLAIGCLVLATACGTKKMAGGYLGEAKGELKPGGSYSATGGIADSNPDVLAVLTQDNETVTLKLGNTVLLSNCELKARIKKPPTAYIISGTICDISVGGRRETISIADGSISVGDYGDADVIINVAGFAGSASTGDYFTFNFRGKSQK